MTKRWLKCEVASGMLQKEQTVTLTTADGKTLSLFAADEMVKTVTGGSAISVELVDQNSTHALVRLPATTLEGSAVVKVKNDQLAA